MKSNTIKNFTRKAFFVPTGIVFMATAILISALEGHIYTENQLTESIQTSNTLMKIIAPSLAISDTATVHQLLGVSSHEGAFYGVINLQKEEVSTSTSTAQLISEAYPSGHFCTHQEAYLRVFSDSKYIITCSPITSKTPFSNHQTLGYLLGFKRYNSSLLPTHIYAIIAALLAVLLLTLGFWIYRILQRRLISPLQQLSLLIEKQSKQPDQLLKDELPEAPQELQEIHLKFNDFVKKTISLSTLEKNEATYKLAKQVAHDLNNFLFSLQQSIKDCPEIPPQNRDKMLGFVKEINRMASSLLEKHREASKGHTERLSTRSITAQLLKALNIAEIPCTVQGYSLKTEISNAYYGLFVSIDPSAFNRILLNLINNAIEAEPKSKSVVISLHTTGNEIEIRIRDDGKGIPAPILSQLGSKELTYGKPNGNGLGLYYVAKTLEKWHGTLHIHSEEHQGTTVSIFLPTAQPCYPWMAQMDLTQIRWILIIDDDPSVHARWKTKLPNTPLKSYYDFESADTAASILPRDGSVLLLVDYQISHSHLNGIQFIVAHQLQAYCLLVTSGHDDEILQQCRMHAVRLLAKEDIELIPVTFASPSHP